MFDYVDCNVSTPIDLIDKRFKNILETFHRLLPLLLEILDKGKWMFPVARKMKLNTDGCAQK